MSCGNLESSWTSNSKSKQKSLNHQNKTRIRAEIRVIRCSFLFSWNCKNWQAPPTLIWWYHAKSPCYAPCISLEIGTYFYVGYYGFVLYANLIWTSPSEYFQTYSYLGSASLPLPDAYLAETLLFLGFYIDLFGSWRSQI